MEDSGSVENTAFTVNQSEKMLAVNHLTLFDVSRLLLSLTTVNVHQIKYIFFICKSDTCVFLLSWRGTKAPCFLWPINANKNNPAQYTAAF